MSAPLPHVQHGAVLAGVKATPRVASSSPDPNSGRRPPAVTESGIQQISSPRFQGLPVHAAS